MNNENKGNPPLRQDAADDPEIRRAMTPLVAMARDLMSEGISRYAVAYALLETVTDLLKDEHMKGNEEFLALRRFLRGVEGDYGDWGKRLDLIDEVADEIRRNRAAGGSGKVIQ